ncbi:MAG: anthranilate synthase component I [Magnetococcus sp. DMHC-6]
MIQPNFEQFQRLAQRGNVVPLYQEILADLDTPVSAYLKVAENQPYAFLLESVEGGEKWGRLSLIGVDPAAIFHAQHNRITIRHRNGESEHFVDQNPMQVLRAFMERFKPVSIPGLPRFHGGVVGYFGYDMVRYFEKIPDHNPDTLNTPDALFMLTDTLLIFDNLLGKLKVVANVQIMESHPEQDLAFCYQAAVARIEQLVAKLRGLCPIPPCDPERHPLSEADFEPEMSQEQFENSVRKAKEYIVAGDIMQVVLSQRLSIPFALPPIMLYRALRTTNPSPYLFLLKLNDFSLVGSSPEILVRVEEDIATVRPIAGTRPRGHSDSEDRALEKELLADPKERAEHIMLVDLGRNDLGRVAQIGSVHLTEQFTIERYSHVMHIVSNVEARLKPGLSCFDVVEATFPAGTVSGAPKIRAMEIIDELEISRRGPYAGTVGYISFDDHMDLAITIRTAILKEGRLYIQAGAGIVADSQPDREFEETMSKARAMFRSVNLAQRGLE